MENKTDKPEPTPADDRLMDAMLREHSRLGSRDDETFLADLAQEMRKQQTKPSPSSKSAFRNDKFVIWSLTIATVATMAATLFILPLFNQHETKPAQQEFAFSVVPRNPSKGDLGKQKIERRQKFPQPDHYTNGSKVPAASGTENLGPSLSNLPPLTSLHSSPPASSPPALKSRGPGRGFGDGVGDGEGPGSGYGTGGGAVGGASLAPRPLATYAPPVSSGGSDRAYGSLPNRKHPFPPQEKPSGPVDRERYGQLVDNPWRSPVDEALSTFSVDVDTASYANFRRLVQTGQRVPADSLRLEEMVNYFDYEYSQPKDVQPFGVSVDAAVTPWNPETRLVRVALQGREVERLKRPAANLVFLIDVSGSMSSPDKLPLVLQSFGILLEELNAEDTLSIVVYAGSEGLALPPTRCDPEGVRRISESLSSLQSGGSTNGGAGITLAYKLARENFKPGGINRVILATDGDFNVGPTQDGDLVSLVEKEAKSKVFLTVLGFGSGNLNDGMLEAITNKGNGTYHYVDGLQEARRVFLQKMMGTLLTIAKDVKIQVEFNPAQVAEFRLLGYANRMLNKEDFNNDRVDAGDIGAGHTVTALYEIRPGPAKPVVDTLKYAPATPGARSEKSSASNEWLTVKLRYKEPEGDTSKLIEQPFAPAKVPELSNTSADFRFATAVALAASVLRETGGLGTATLTQARELAAGAKGADPHGLRAEFVALLDRLIRLEK